MLLNLFKRNLIQSDTISVIEYITRNPTNFKEVKLRDSISKLVDNGILINKKTKQDLESFFCK